MLKRASILLAVLVLVLGSFAGCGEETTPTDTGQNGGNQDGPQVGGEIVYALTGDPVIFNPILSTDSTSGAINDLVYEGLIEYNKDLQPVGCLAENWDISEDGLTITFHLRDNVKWHDGTPFTAEDVKFTYDAIMHPDYTGTRASYFKFVEEVEVVDPHTVALHLKQVDSSLIYKLSIGIIPKHIFGDTEIAKLKEHEGNQNPIGTGPFKFSEYESGQYIVLVRNEDYWREGPYLERVRFKIFQDEQVVLTALEDGSIDYLGSIPVEDIERIKEAYADRFNFVERPYNGYQYIGFNLTHPILSDKKVRHALVYAVDREAIIDTIYKGYGTVMNGHYPPISWAFNENLPTYDYNPEKAAQLLEEAGWKLADDGFRYKDGEKLAFTVVASSGNTQDENLLSMVKKYWKDVGVDATIEYYEWSVLVDEYLDKGNFEAYKCGWGLGLDPDPYMWWHSECSFDENGILQGFNDVRFKNERVDELIELGRSTYDQDERKQYYDEMQMILSDELPYMWLYTRNFVTAMHKKFEGVEWSALGPINIHKWYVNPDYLK